MNTEQQDPFVDSAYPLDPAVVRRYGRRMPANGGLKLMLQPATPQDRRARFAQVTVARAGSQEAVVLVTDACGRMRYRLPDGDYHLSLVAGSQAGFSVRDHCWTTVRLQLA
jgi:hypothetical protein